MRAKRPTPRQLEYQVAQWNRQYPVGTPVTLREDSGQLQDTKTRSLAEVLSGHSAVIWLEGSSACWPLDRVTPRAGATEESTRL